MCVLCVVPRERGVLAIWALAALREFPCVIGRVKLPAYSWRPHCPTKFFSQRIDPVNHCAVFIGITFRTEQCAGIPESIDEFLLKFAIASPQFDTRQRTLGQKFIHDPTFSRRC